MSRTAAPASTDGRRRKGEERRRLLREATLRVVGRGGVAAVTQRAVAAEAGMTPSLVSYHYPTVDALLSATLAAVNDDCVAALERCAREDDPVRALAEFVAGYASGRTEALAAEYELFLQAGRHPALRAEWVRWTAALDALLAPLVTGRAARAAAAAGVDGVFLRCWCDPEPWSAAACEEVLRALVAR
ncbi:TetR/AcrR family transcriptional regulator [Actinomycetospora cinnamomea]|uniref:TetR family transcriptional regulator n=1 Tax=Actinomycetospora cinnamomea TaxID=663609 RepID=A0A2U1E8J1_9PSEU|nr:TetR family transcriptional regulator [Actinomycetospora cinnamomea]PVY96029.1 TetR family transcriptional regulator [Actinomycetospora cinnamomea]